MVLLTSEEVILQASFGHKLIHQKPVLTIQAVSDQLDKIRVMKFS